MSVEISPPHMVILKVIREAGPMSVSEIGKRHGISKPQMTHLIDRLVYLDLVERQPDKADRRVINIALTDRGDKALDEFRALMIVRIKQKLACLDDGELEQLSDSLCKIRGILTKL
jgi:DNA-binding MarR family transcriptional regulator